MAMLRARVFTYKQYRLGCSITIKVHSQPCGGTIADTVVYLQLSNELIFQTGHFISVNTCSVSACWVMCNNGAVMPS